MSDNQLLPQEFLRSLNANTYRAAYERGLSLSAYLDEIHPESEFNDGLDGFGRLLKIAGIRTKSLLDQGVHASSFDAFFKNDQTRALLPEWVARQQRAVVHAHKRSTFYTSGNDAPGTSANPWIDAGARAGTQIAPAIPLAEMVAFTTPIDSDAYRAYYIDDTAADRSMVRVSPGAEIPTVRITGSDQTIRLYKYGRAVEMTYEYMRRLPIDKVGFYIQRVAVQAETDKVNTVIDTIVNGDGNAGTAATVLNLTALDAGTTANNLTTRAWLNFKLQFATPYMITTAISRSDTALSLMLLNTGSANIPLVNIQQVSNFGEFRQINPGLRDAVALGWTSFAPSAQIVGFDSRFAVERAIEIGASISEVEKFVSRQTEKLVMTETEGYAILDKNASKILNLAA